MVDFTVHFVSMFRISCVQSLTVGLYLLCPSVLRPIFLKILSSLSMTRFYSTPPSGHSLATRVQSCYTNRDLFEQSVLKNLADTISF